jgi:predicted dehydrogenase
MKQYNAGIVGLGRMGSLFEEDPLIKKKPCSHAGAYTALKNIKLACACDVRQDRLDRFSKTWGIKSLYMDYKEMLKKEKFDILSICTHAPEHKDICIAAAESGVKAIFCEKPMATSLMEAEEMIKACKKNNVILAVNHTRRWDSIFQNIKELLRNNKIGNIQLLEAYSTVGLLNGGTHLFDLLRYYVGDAASVQGYIEKDESTDPGGYGTIIFKNGIRCNLDALWRDYVLFGINIIGTQGLIKGSGMIRGNKSFELWLSQKSENESKVNELVQTNVDIKESRVPLINAVNDIIGCIENKKQPACTGEDGKAALEMALALHESHNKGNIPIRLPLKNKDLRIIPRETSFTKTGLLEE